MRIAGDPDGTIDLQSFDEFLLVLLGDDEVIVASSSSLPSELDSSGLFSLERANVGGRGPLTSESTSEATRRPSDVDSVRCCRVQTCVIGTAGFEPATP